MLKIKHFNWYTNWSECREVKNQERNLLKWWSGEKVERYVDFKQSLDQIYVAKLINYEIDENVFLFAWVHGGNVVVQDEFSVPTTIDKNIYINNSKTKKSNEIKLPLSF